jgi:hypothetical protein
MRNRERDGLPGNKFSPTQKQIADEIADVVTYLDLLAHVLGVDLGRAAATKFNEVSERVGFPDRIVLASRPQPVTDAYTLQPARGGNWQAPFHANRTRFGYADRIDDVNDKTLVHLNTGTMRNESEGGVEYLLSLLNRSARGEVSEAEVEAAALAIAKVRFGASVAWPENVVEAKVALEAAARVRESRLAGSNAGCADNCTECQKCEHCGGSGFVNVIDEDGEAFADVCDGPAHDHASHVGFDAGLEVGGTAHRKVKP